MFLAYMFRVTNELIHTDTVELLALLFFRRAVARLLASTYRAASLLASSPLNDASFNSWLISMLMPIITWSDSVALTDSGI